MCCASCSTRDEDAVHLVHERTFDAHAHMEKRPLYMEKGPLYMIKRPIYMYVVPHEAHVMKMQHI